MKKMVTIVLGLVMMSMLAACGSEETFNFGADDAIVKARDFVKEDGINQIVEVINSYEYETEEGAKGVIFEVRLGVKNQTLASTDYVKVWKNNIQSNVQASWSDLNELEKKKQTTIAGQY